MGSQSEERRVIRLKEYIAILEGKLLEYGNVLVGITEEGNYSGGGLADLYENPRVEFLHFGEETNTQDIIVHKSSIRRGILVLGHSDQWC